MSVLRRRKRMTIYLSRVHIAVTGFFILVPFLFLILFSRYADIALGTLLADVATSMWRLLIAFGFSLVLGWLMAVLFYKGRRAVIALPLFDVLQSFPTFAALPIATYIWGPSNATVIFFLVLTIVWPIFFSVLSSLKLIKHDWEDAVAMSGLSGFNYFRLFIVPVTIPGVITGSVIGLGEGWEALVATEVIVRLPNGLGSFFDHFSQNTTVTALGIFGFLLLIFSINKLIWLPLLEWSHRYTEE